MKIGISVEIDVEIDSPSDVSKAALNHFENRYLLPSARAKTPSKSHLTDFRKRWPEAKIRFGFEEGDDA
jgi:hypothetical protein